MVMTRRPYAKWSRNRAECIFGICRSTGYERYCTAKELKFMRSILLRLNHANRPRFVRRVALGAVLALSALGCGNSDDRVAVYPVRGTAFYRGAPAEGAKITLYDVDRKDATIPFPSGEVQPDGTFRLTSYQAGDGAPASTYKVTVIWREPMPEGVNPEMYSPADRLGGRYSDPERSTLEVTVTKGDNVLEPFQLE